MTVHEFYDNPLCGRYADEEMKRIFSDDRKFSTWRRLWLLLAESEQALGLPITDEQLGEMRAHLTDIDYEAAVRYEHKVRHDVMAHVLAFGDLCPAARPIIHLGATSCYVGDNTDILNMRDGLRHIRRLLMNAAEALASFAERWKGQSALAYTHFQAAQPTTVGKRACLWLNDLLFDIRQLDFQLAELRPLGCKGATGTAAGFLELFDGDAGKVLRLEEMIVKGMGFDRCQDVSGQTYTRKADYAVLQVLSGIAQTASKFAGDVRLLCHEKELDEPAESGQIGSSAMAYKRNPMRCERICSLSRYLIADAANAPMTASVQWFERTLDDSANRRISMPEGFLCADAILRLARNVTGGLRVNEKIIEKTVREYLPFIATEDLLMEAVKRGGDRQQLHEIIRRCSMEATAKMKEGGECDLLERLSAEKEFGLSAGDMERILEPSLYIGRCSGQVSRFLEKVAPLLADADDSAENIEI